MRSTTLKSQMLLGPITMLQSTSAQSTTVWYAPPPTLTNNLTFALTGPGTNGFIYNTSSPSNAPYNYCNMPHALSTPQNYPFPDLDNFELIYVELTHRHHKRTPYSSNMFPREDVNWDCSNTELKFYGESKGSGWDANRIWWKTYQDPLNPLRIEQWHGNCQFPQETKGGLEDSRRHGKDLYMLYGERLRLLPKKPDNSTVFRVTSNVITSQVAGALLQGMYPLAQNTGVLQQYPTIDSLQPAYPCPAADAIRSSILDEPRWKEHLERSKPLFAKLDDLSGIDPNDSGWHVSWDHYFDAISSRMCHQIPLPCKIGDPSTCVAKDVAETVLRLGQWEYAYLWRDSEKSLAYSSLRFGIFLNELNGHIKVIMDGDESVKYRHNVAHDGSISMFLSALQVDEMVWPGMGAELVIEVWRDLKNRAAAGKNGKRIRVLWGGKVLKSSSPDLGELDMISAEKFGAYLKGLIGEGAREVMEKCGY
ncbi:histidine acid phosphatase-like protein [Tirmania nivea]|nr:histidine acid phosphatase-like protein [Tirmania nivea]